LNLPRPFPAEGCSTLVQLRVMETTDLHVHLMPYDYYADRPEPGVGLMRTAELVDEARREAPNALLFDNGDFLQGTPVGDYLANGAYLPGAGGEHPVMAAMNALGYDAITLGNHEFNYGLDFLERAIADAQFPVVSANLARKLGSTPRADTPYVKPYALLDRMVIDNNGTAHPIRIGVIGFLPPQIIRWERHLLEGRLWTRDIVESAQAWVPEMREAGADIILALAHSGIGAAQHSNGMENASVPLGRVDGIDALLTGHSHLVFPSPLFRDMPEIDAEKGTISGKPAVMAGFWGSHLGIIDLLLTHEGGRWHVISSRSEARPINPAPPKPALPDTSPARIAEAIAVAHSGTIAANRKPVGHSTTNLQSYFTALGVAPTVRLVAAAQRDHVAQQLASGPLAGLPLLSAAAPYKAGGRAGAQNYTEITAGALVLRNVADLYIYPNTAAVLRLSGAELREWMERVASCYNRITPDSPTDMPLINPAFPSYNCELVDGLDWEVDLSRPARYLADGRLRDPDAYRISDLKYQGQPVSDAQSFLLCTNSYRAGGAGSFPGARPENLVWLSRQPTRELVRRFIAGRRAVAPETAPMFRFAPLGGLRAVFETGPGALRYLDTIAIHAPEALEASPEGFARISLRF